MKALILAGGRGSRLNKFTKDKNKSMIELFEKPLIQYNLDHAVEAKVSEIIIVVGYKKEHIIKHVGREYCGTKITYVEQKQQKGVVHAIECAKKSIGDSDFFLMLGDEILINAKIKEMIKKFKKQNLFGICGITFENDKLKIGKTYSAMANESGRIFRLIEKPKFPINKIKGTGHCIFKNEILKYIEKTPISMKRGEKELVDMIQEAIDEGKVVDLYKISENYVNVNLEEDLKLVEKIIKINNPKILLVHTQMKFIGGAELLLIELSNWLTKRGVKNDILTLSSCKEVEKRLINTKLIIPKHNIDLKPPGFKNTKDILNFVRVYRKKLRKLIKDYDVINFHNFPVTWTLYPKKKPCVWMLNEPPNLWSKPNANFILKIMNKFRVWLDKFIIRNSVDIICVADELNKERAKIRYQKDSEIVHYGVNYDFFSKGDAKKIIDRFDIKNKFIVIQSGMLTEIKNQLESLKTINKVRNKIPNILLILAGKIDKNYKKKIEDYIKKNELEKYVLITDNLEREDLRNLYKACDLGLFPVGKQGGWLAPFELLCSGNPIIVSEDLGAASLIKQFNLGIVTKNYEDSVIEVYNNLKQYKLNAKKASLFVKKNLGWDVFTDKLIKTYKDAWKRY